MMKQVNEVIFNEPTGKSYLVDETQAKLYDYSNKDNTITYNAPEIDSKGVQVGNWVNYQVTGKVTDIEQRMHSWNNSVSLAYAYTVSFNWHKHDPKRQVWHNLINYVTNHQDKFFDENGDWLKQSKMNLADIQKVVERKAYLNDLGE